ncbi:MAG: ABC transporter permease [Rhodospirillaceae bacterium]|nr:ABC transporter permease [Rhodospirillaceae bacterium]MYB14577.1 ABC transporter permease [Rhodospirillaceae bacterium]MYI47918.1 ABC transporter permease [Rhodospirillaceae bacterium]
MDFWSTRNGRILNVALVLLGFGLIWEGAVIVFGIKPFLLPAPSRVLADIAAEPLWYGMHTLETLKETALGFLLAVVVGLAMAIGIVFSRFVEQTLYTFLVAINSIPKVAVAPLFIVWFGAGIEPKVAIAFLIAVFPIVIDTVLGLRSVEPDMLDLARSMRGSAMQTLWKIRFPTALPSMFAGMKVGISFAFIGAIVGEFVASQAGLGFVIDSAQPTFDTTRIFAAILLLAVVGTILFYTVELAERAFVPWHVSRRREGTAGPAPQAAH